MKTTMTLVLPILRSDDKPSIGKKHVRMMRKRVDRFLSPEVTICLPIMPATMDGDGAC